MHGWKTTGHAIRLLVQRRAVALVAAMLIINLGIFAWFCIRPSESERTARAMAPTKSYTGVQEQRERIDQIIHEISVESLPQLQSRLLEPFLYKYPGFVTGRKFDQVQLEELISNRRVMRLLSMVQRLTFAERHATCDALFRSMLTAHTEAIDRIIAHEKDSNTAANQQQLSASVLAVGTSVYLTARFTDVRMTLNDVEILLALEQNLRARIDNDEELRPVLRAMMQNYYIPDNRVLLNVLLIAVDRLDGKSEELRSLVAATKEKCTGRELTLVAFDASLTEFDHPHRLEGLPIDTSKGSEQVICHWWPDEIYNDTSAQRVIISELRDALVRSVSHAK